MNKFKIAIFSLFAILSWASFAVAQSAPKGSKSPAPVVTTEAATLVKATQEYKASLGDLASSYESNAAQAEEHLKKLKSLYDDGLLSRKDFEAAQAAATAARSKIDETRKQIVEADATIAEALKPKPADAMNAIATGGVTNWSTGNARYDALIRDNGKRFGVDPYLIFCVMEQESHFNASATSPLARRG